MDRLKRSGALSASFLGVHLDDCRSFSKGRPHPQSGQKTSISKSCSKLEHAHQGGPPNGHVAAFKPQSIRQIGPDASSSTHLKYAVACHNVIMTSR
jgi:hypothetical protein